MYGVGCCPLSCKHWHMGCSVSKSVLARVLNLLKPTHAELFSRPFNYEISRFGLILLLASRMFTHTNSSVGSVHTLSALSLALPPQGPWSILFWISFEKIRVLAGVRTFWGCSLYPYLMTLFMYWHSSFGGTHRCTLCQWNVYFFVPSIPRPTIIILCCSTSLWMRLHYCEWYVCRISSRVLGLL